MLGESSLKGIRSYLHFEAGCRDRGIRHLCCQLSLAAFGNNVLVGRDKNEFADLQNASHSPKSEYMYRISIIYSAAISVHEG